MKTNLVLALVAATTLLSACGGFQSSIGPAKLGGPIAPKVEPSATEKALIQLDGSEFNKIQDPTDLPSITSLSVKLTGKAAPFQYEITMTPKGMDQRASTDQISIAATTADKLQFSIISQSVNVAIIENGSCLSLTVPNQSESVFFNDVEPLSAAIVICK